MTLYASLFIQTHKTCEAPQHWSGGTDWTLKQKQARQSAASLLPVQEASNTTAFCQLSTPSCLHQHTQYLFSEVY